MTQPAMTKDFGRRAFGDNPANYNASRPPYPDAVWQVLRDRANLKPGIRILEIGAGAGLATAQLLAHQPNRLLAVEPDPRSTDFMRQNLTDPRLKIVNQPFEEIDLHEETFDLVACATAFHWLDSSLSLQKIRTLLEPQGKLALWWNVFGDNSRPDPFHVATAHLFARHRNGLSAAGTDTQLPYALDVSARLADFQHAGFAVDQPEFIQWALPLDAVAMRNLYSTFSNVKALPEDEQIKLLDSLVEIATRDFAGHIQRNMTTAIYIASH